MKIFRLLLLLASIPRLLFSESALSAHSVQGLLNQGKANQAIAVLNQHLQVSPRNPEAHNLLCRVYYQEERWERAATECERAASLDPENSTYQLWLGRAYGQKAAHSGFVTAASLASKVRMAFEKAVQLDPNSVEARSDLSEFYIEAPAFMGGGSDKAVAQAEAIARQNVVAAHWLRARVAEHRKQMDTAESEYKKAIAAAVDPAPHLIDLASFYRRTGRLDEMEKSVNLAAAASARNGTELFDGGSMLLRAGRNFPGAIQLLGKYLASDAKAEVAPAFQAYFRLGTLLEKRGDAAGAADAYKKALDLASDYAPAQSALRDLQSNR